MLAYLFTTNTFLIESKYDRIIEMWIQGNYPHAENHNILIGNQSSQTAAASQLQETYRSAYSSSVSEYMYSIIVSN